VLARPRPRPWTCTELGFGPRTCWVACSPPERRKPALKWSARISSSTRSRSRGFSLVELAVSLLIVVVLTAMAIPSLMNSLHAYQLNDAAARVSDLLKFTRFEAVRKNTQISFLFQQIGGYWVIGTDSNGNSLIDPTERQNTFTGFATLLPATGTPATTPILTALGVGALTTLSGGPGSVTFDARGAVRVGGAITTTVFIFYVGNGAHPEAGYRAVVVLPAGSTQVWMAPPGGTWLRLS